MDKNKNEPKQDIIIHRIPTCESFLNNHLTSTYTVLDPIASVGTDPNSIKTYLRLHGSEARALVCVEPIPLGKDILDCLPSLGCVVTSTTGTDHIDVSECRKRGILVANLGDTFSDDVADYAVGLLIDVLRGVSAGERFIRDGSWVGLREFPLGVRLTRKRVGIVGLGNIGLRIAKRLASFDFSIAYTSRRNKHSVSFAYYNNVHDLAFNTDILILCCSLTSETHHMISTNVLTALGKDGILINVGRGALVNEMELMECLTSGGIAGAGLDVFEDEPNVPKDLVGLENVVLTAHHAVCTHESFKAIIDVVVANLEAFFTNKPLLTPVTWE